MCHEQWLKPSKAVWDSELGPRRAQELNTFFRHHVAGHQLLLVDLKMSGQVGILDSYLSALLGEFYR